jgi:hypothetical protein
VNERLAVEGLLDHFAAAVQAKDVLRIPMNAMDEAMQAGAITKMTWGKDRITDLKQDYGDDWIFGKYLKQEPEWLRAMYNVVEE